MHHENGPGAPEHHDLLAGFDGAEIDIDRTRRRQRRGFRIQLVEHRHEIERPAHGTDHRGCTDRGGRHPQNVAACGCNLGHAAVIAVMPAFAHPADLLLKRGASGRKFMAGPRTLDVHTHILTEETMGIIRKEIPALAPRLIAIDSEFAVLEIGGTAYRPFPRGGWDMERRLADMAAAEVDVQILSASPQSYLYGEDPKVTAACAAIQNEQIARHVAALPDRFLGIATLPMQAPELAAAELARAVKTLGLRGAMIGSNVEGKNLDDPGLEPVWAAA